MKAKKNFSLRRAFAFLIIMCASLIFITSCEKDPLPPVVTEPSIELLDPEDISNTSATLVAKVNPVNKPAAVVFEYFNGKKWEMLEIAYCQGSQESIVKKTCTKLKPKTEYQLRALLQETRDNYFILLATSETKTFTTLNPPDISIMQAKATYTEINLQVKLVPKETNVRVRVDYLVNGETHTQTSGAYSGGDPALVNFKLDGLAKDTRYPVKITAIGSGERVIDTTLVSAAVQDYDGNYYRTVTIGNQVWLMDNFCGTNFANGDPIPHLPNPSAWEATTTPAYTYYNNSAELGAIYGGLYNWYVASDPRGLIVGYHTPTEGEWKVLADALGGYKVAGIKMKENSGNYWQYSPDHPATNASGFSALPAGLLADGAYCRLRQIAKFWTGEKEDFLQCAYLVVIFYDSDSFDVGGILSPYRWGLSVRLIKN